MIKKIEQGANCQANLYYWTESPTNHRFDFYGFNFERALPERSAHVHPTMLTYLRLLPPHELYQETNKFVPRLHGYGKKRAALVVEIVERYRRDNPSHFCECGEPFLHWYKYCPTCGKEIGG